MKRALARCAVVVLVWAPTIYADPVAPEFSLPTIGDPQKEVLLTEYRGRFVYVDFWASWCKPCREALPFYDRLQQEIGAESLQIIGIAVDENPDDARAFLQKWPVSYPTLRDRDGAVLNAYGVKTMPTGFLINPAGRILFAHRGFRKKDKQKLEQAIREAISPP